MQGNDKINKSFSFTFNNDDTVKHIADIINQSNIISKYPSSTINPNIITECKRRIFYKVSGEKYENKSLLKEEHEKAIVQKWVNFLSKCDGIYVIDTGVTFVDSECNICFNVDAIADIKDKCNVVKIKPVNDIVFQSIKEKGIRRKDVIEVIVQLWLARLKDGILIYENYSNQDYVIFHVVPHKPIINAVIKKCKEIVGYQIRASKPDRVSSDECCICEFKNKCSNGG